MADIATVVLHSLLLSSRLIAKQEDKYDNHGIHSLLLANDIRLVVYLTSNDTRKHLLAPTKISLQDNRFDVEKSENES